MGALLLRGLALVTVAATVAAVSGAAVATAAGSTLVAQVTAPDPSTSTGPSSTTSPTALPPTDQERRRVTRLRRCLRVLKPTDRRILTLRYGLDGRDAAAVDGVAQQTGLSVGRIQFVERRALRQLRRAVAAGPLCRAPRPAPASPAATTTKSRPPKSDASSAAESSNSSSRHYMGLGLLILGLAGLAGVLVYTMREVRRSL